MKLLNLFPFASFLFLLLIISGRIYYLRQKGIQISSKKERKGKNKAFLYPVFLLVFLVWLFEVLKPAFQINLSILPETITSNLINSNNLKIVGVLITFISLVLWTLTMLHFKTSIRFGLNDKNKGKLITSGVFAYSRNPFFLSLDLYFLGISLMLPNLFFIGFAVLTVISIHFFILKEEKFMLKAYGIEYKKYVSKVGRYFYF